MIASESHEFVAESGTAVAFRDTYPLPLGHSLVMPRRHVTEPGRLGREGLTRDLWRLGTSLCGEPAREPGISGFNVGINLGRAAGRTDTTPAPARGLAL